MKVRVLALAGAAMLFAGAALADDPMANVYGNTITTKDRATGASSTLMFNQDMSYTGKMTGANGQAVSYTGTWMLKDGGKTICLTPNVPAGTANAPAPVLLAASDPQCRRELVGHDGRKSDVRRLLTAGR